MATPEKRLPSFKAISACLIAACKQYLVNGKCVHFLQLPPGIGSARVKMALKDDIYLKDDSLGGIMVFNI